jgi:hypothetical protein
MTLFFHLFLYLGLASLVAHLAFNSDRAKRVMSGRIRERNSVLTMLFSFLMFALAALSVIVNGIQKERPPEGLARDPIQQFLRGEPTVPEDLWWVVNPNSAWTGTAIREADKIGMDVDELKNILTNELFLIRLREPSSLSLSGKKLDGSPLQRLLIGEQIAWKDLSWVVRTRHAPYWSQYVDEEAARLDIDPVKLEDVLKNEIYLIRSKPIRSPPTDE